MIRLNARKKSSMSWKDYMAKFKHLKFEIRLYARLQSGIVADVDNVMEFLMIKIKLLVCVTVRKFIFKFIFSSF